MKANQERDYYRQNQLCCFTDWLWTFGVNLFDVSHLLSQSNCLLFDHPFRMYHCYQIRERCWPFDTRQFLALQVVICDVSQDQWTAPFCTSSCISADSCSVIIIIAGASSASRKISYGGNYCEGWGMRVKHSTGFLAMLVSELNMFCCFFQMWELFS